MSPKKNVERPAVSSEILPKAVLHHHGKTLFGPMREWQTHQRIPPVLLMTGQSGIGKRAMAYFLAQWMLCEESGFKSNGIEPCGHCSSCLKIEAKNDVDFIEVSPETDEDSSASSGTLKIEQFRKLKASAGFGAHEGNYKIILIPYADRMTIQAANSVLKLLEEPPRGWIFLLTTHDQTLLLPTIVSRCQILRLKPFSTSEIQGLLVESGIATEKAKICAQLAQGSWTRALTFAEDEVWEQKKVLFQFLKDPASVLQALVDWTTQKPSNLDVLIDLLEQFTADLIRWSMSSNISDPQNYSWAYSDGQKEFSVYAKRTLQKFRTAEAARKYWFSQIERLAQTRQEALAPLNRKLLVQGLLIPWLGGNS